MGNTFEADQLSMKLMSWKETCAMEQRLTFVKAIEEGDEYFAELCRAYGISRKTGYKWRKRYESGGAPALADQSRAPHQQAHAIPEQIAKAILGARGDHRRWGPEKLRAWLQRKQPEQHWPSASTIGEILKRAGLTAKRGPRLWVAPTPGRLQPAETANAVWCADFKGYFHCQDGSRCDPLTVTDAYSRYLLRCQAVDGLDEKYARALFEAAFREYGLPNTIRTDNGAPFASVALAGLSALSVWWIKLGIWPERIDPGKPQQNGRHERIHRTLREATAEPPSTTLSRQQRAFDEFREEYNHERPHAALEMKTPGEFYQPSCRNYPNRLRTPEYNGDLLVRGVGSCGRIHWSGERIFITKTLAHEPIGLERVADGIWKLWFGNYPIGWMDERTMQVTDLNNPPKRLPNTKTQAEQNLSKMEKPNPEAASPPEAATEREMT
jgi:putative transposase